MTWKRGRPEVERLIETNELERVTPDAVLARSMVAEAARHVESAARIVAKDPVGAYQLAYDALRKAAAALLAEQGLRSTSRGGHTAIRDAVTAQFGGPKGTPAFRAFDRLRRTRNRLEYPSNTGPSADLDDAEDAIHEADGAIRFADELLQTEKLTPF